MRSLNKSVVAGGVVYPAGASGPGVEAAVSNPDHWDGGDPTDVTQIVQVGIPPEIVEKVNELVSQLERSASQLEALLGAVGPLIDADPEDLYDTVFETDSGLDDLASRVAGLVATADDQGGDDPADQSTSTPVDYSGLSKKDLEAEVIKRNADGRDSDIVVAEPGNKPDLIAALTADDE